jgi:3-deoxy-D-manno-octulosonic-acid transferase
MGKALYNAGVWSFYVAVKLASAFSEKAQLWIEGRVAWRDRLKKAVSAFDSNSKTIWFHVSSLGEFEQGRPVMEELKKTKNINLLLSFYSPSGFEQMKDWSVADAIVYLPLDTEKNAIDFIKIAQPDLSIFVKYDLWYHYLKQLKENCIPVLLISARFYSTQAFFKKWASWYKSLLFLFDRILVQDQVSYDLLQSIAYKNVSISGDIRYDRVDELSRNSDDFPKIKSFIKAKKVFIAGSSWPLDEKIMLDYFLKNEHDLRVIIAPHDIGKEHIKSLIQQYKGLAVSYSDFKEKSEAKVLIIDSIGILSRIYKLAHIAYIGGAFKEGLHNILEPAAYGIPVITGSDHKGFPEGSEMEKAGALFKVDNESEFVSIINTLLTDEHAYSEANRNAKKFIQDRKGACLQTLNSIENYI